MSGLKSLPTLYDKDSHGRIRTWTMFHIEDSYWSESGVEGGKVKVDKPRIAKPKNVGRANETTGEEQAALEARSKWDKKIKEGYQQDKAKAGEYYFFKPMLADKYPSRNKKITEIFNKGGHVYCQPKLDGIRCIMRLEDGRIVARSRMGSEFDTLDHIKAALKQHFDADPNLVLDGELYNHKFKDNFNKIVSLIKQEKPKRKDGQTNKAWAKKWAEWEENVKLAEKYAQYHIYDMPQIGDLTTKDNFIERWGSWVREYEVTPLVATSKVHNQKELDEFYELYLEQGYEGQMIRMDAPYESDGRPISLLKRKEFIDIEAEILQITEGNGNWAGCAKSITAKMDNGIEFDSNTVGDFEYTKDLLDNKDKYIGKQATFRFLNYTPDGKPRCPHMHSIRDYE